jgi:ketosteroid isomerase-like protein
MKPEELLRCAELALEDLDSDRLVSLYTPDFVFEDVSSGDRITEKAKLKAYFDQLFSMPNVSFKDVDFFQVGDRAAGKWTWCGNSLQSGQDYAIRGASLFRLGEYGIEEEIIFYDPRSAYA